MNSQNISPGNLALRLLIYFSALMGTIAALIFAHSDVIQYLPIGGTHALSGGGVDETKDLLNAAAESQAATRQLVAPGVDLDRQFQRISLFLTGHLVATILIMIPITWTYNAINQTAGFNKNFSRALIVLPICATTIVLLIQDSLALAFGLAALVAAVRFRVVLDEAIDGIFVFAAICVGLAAGIGYVGVAVVMSIFFCFANLVLWKLDYGRNPYDDAIRKKKRAKLIPAPSDVAPGPN